MGLAWSLGLTLAGCAGEASDVPSQPDAGVPFDSGGFTPNGCGGSTIFLDRPGEPCGRCGSGQWVCEGPERLRCLGELPPNACGGCEALPGVPNQPCGCDGRWECTADGGLRCTATDSRNACGGCASLGDERPGFACSGVGGIFACSSANETTCVLGITNLCGGAGPLDRTAPELATALPGDPCGTCGLGIVQCDTAERDRLICTDAERGANACGGCIVLAAEPGEPCGCGGAWACDPERVGHLTCVGGRDDNGCGGCDPLVVSADAPCEAGQIRTCAGPLTTRCVEVGSPLCGGAADSGGPGVGDSCGACNDGVWQCDASGEPMCVGATEPNACGGCGTLPAAPGSTCGEGRAWTCEGGEPRCARAPGLNRCGGAGVLDGVPGESCGACGTGLVACISTDLTACLQQGLAARNACGGCRALPGLPGEACGVCDSGVWQCDGDDALTCVGEYADARFDLYADRDGDGFGDPTVVEAQCPGTPGWSINPDDCDDTDALRQPGAPERCNERDDDCDGGIDEGFEAWRDGDGDGYGNPAMPRTMCTLEPGYARNPDDCDDGNGNTRPGAPWSRSPRRDGSWDRNCDGVVSIRYRDEARCTTSGTCDEIGGDERNEGWAGAVPACGVRALWLTACVLDETGACVATGDSLTQQCR